MSVGIGLGASGKQGMEESNFTGSSGLLTDFRFSFTSGTPEQNWFATNVTIRPASILSIFSWVVIRSILATWFQKAGNVVALSATLQN